MSTHTPGPWIREGLLVYALHHNGDFRKGIPVAVNRFSTQVQACIGQGGTAEEAEANARLIAAAPELLEFLKVLMEDQSAYPWHRAASTLIAKAEGK
jgi:hypothetical protein